MKPSAPSEFSLIEFIRSQDQAMPENLLRQIGDDCAVFDPAKMHRMVASTDLLIEDTHFRNRWTTPRWLGRKACAVNASDLAAMGAAPYASLLCLGLPTERTGAYFREFILGFLEENRKYGMTLIGGDLSASLKVTVAVTVLGSIEEGEPIYRSGARAGDLILTIGKLGYSRAGLEHLRKHADLDISSIRSLDELEKVAGCPEAAAWLEAHNLPEAQVTPACWLRRGGLANAMIDISDGLGNDLLHILEESGVSAEIDLARLEAIAGISSVETSRDLSLNGGEDYALLFTASEQQYDRIRSAYPAAWPPFRVLGRITPGRGELYLLESGRKTPYSRKGYDHFE